MVQNYKQHNGKRGDDDLNELDYETIMKMQQSMRKESEIIVIDEVKPRNCVEINAVDLGLFIVGKSPIKTGRSFRSPEYGQCAAKPISVERDDHVIFVRDHFVLSQTTKARMIQKLNDNLSKDELALLLQFMQYVSMEVQETENNKDILMEIAKLNAYNEDMRHRILQIWFHQMFDGPSLITRILLYREDLNGRKSDFSAPVLSEMYEEFQELQNQDYIVNWLIIVDSIYYPFTKKVSNNMKWPNKLNLDYVGVYASTDKIEEIEEREIELLVTKEKFKISVVESDEKQYRVKLVPTDATVFDNMAIQLYLLSNSKFFLDWIEQQKLCLWKGREEQNKLKDIRNVTHKLEKTEDKLMKTEDEVKRLRDMISDDDI